MKVLSSPRVAHDTQRLSKASKAKHLLRLLLLKLDKPFIVPPLLAGKDNVLACIKLFPKESSYGCDSLHAQHLLDSMSGVALVVPTYHSDALTSIMNLRMQVHCPRSSLN